MYETSKPYRDTCVTTECRFRPFPPMLKPLYLKVIAARLLEGVGCCRTCCCSTKLFRPFASVLDDSIVIGSIPFAHDVPVRIAGHTLHILN